MRTVEVIENLLFTAYKAVDKNAEVPASTVLGYFFTHNSITQPAQKGNGSTMTDNRATNGQLAQNKLAVAGLTKRSCEVRGDSDNQLEHRQFVSSS